MEPGDAFLYGLLVFLTSSGFLFDIFFCLYCLPRLLFVHYLSQKAFLLYPRPSIIPLSFALLTSSPCILLFNFSLLSAIPSRESFLLKMRFDFYAIAPFTFHPRISSISCSSAIKVSFDSLTLSLSLTFNFAFSLCNFA